MSNEKQRERCFICGQGNPATLEEHHAVPRRYNGSDQPENLYYLCGSCHNAIEKMYDDEFYERLGIAVDRYNVVHDSAGGAVVEPQKSIGREIPASNRHIRHEEWTHQINVSDLAEANKGQYNGKYTDFIKRHAPAMLAKYGEELQVKTKLQEEYLKNNDVPEEDKLAHDEHPYIELNYEHDDLLNTPVIKVINTNLNGRGNIKSRAKILKESKQNYDINKGSRRQTTASPAPFNDGENYPTYYRLHCAYCHTVFTQYQHEDLARHLRLKHGYDIFADIDKSPEFGTFRTGVSKNE